MEFFNIVAGVASIAGLIISICSLTISSKVLYMLNQHYDNSKTSNKVTRSMINGDFVGRDKK